MLSIIVVASFLLYITALVVLAAINRTLVVLTATVSWITQVVDLRFVIFASDNHTRNCTYAIVSE